MYDGFDELFPQEITCTKRDGTSETFQADDLECVTDIARCPHCPACGADTAQEPETQRVYCPVCRASDTPAGSST